MGIAKRQLEELETKNFVALEIAIEAGVLQRCEHHDDAIFEGDADIEDAYKLGNAKFSRGELGNHFESRREMTDAIKGAVETHCAGECYSSAKWRNE